MMLNAIEAVPDPGSAHTAAQAFFKWSRIAILQPGFRTNL
jgi:hypothetical protein